ncbi:hypothetical protein ASPZODRAFT_146089 [Penicilliopsis zonata CBS 506.65]|uniref:Btz domain-containing protein n=1 Tax=Penicilliopsis zonata CBS 506.65 TaxID=1073090 RepID=A0A1L9S887_9EURO|nr:hypothetical protein ASPZODRAFT_146089 [Penicilliopsis zonata CBS 506.65]OJJ43375.1 hypothetical protein ASPZODRAFT_146089 [Penicilliopsis zonata CBS 506.65]
MAPSHRRNIGASRRKRRDEEGEDEGSVNGELEDDSLSEGSVGTHQDEDDDDDDADGEVSNGSEDEAAPGSGQAGYKNNGTAHAGVRDTAQQGDNKAVPAKKGPSTQAISDTETMMNGLKISEHTSDTAEVHYDELEGSDRQTASAEPKRETFAEKKRRENEKYVKERDENPAFVPTRGSFFLHDKRSTDPGSNGHRPFNKSKTRPYGLIVDGNVRKNPPKSDASEGQWTHDLHDTVAGDDRFPSKSPVVSSTGSLSGLSKPVPTAPRSSPPNRSFSTTVLIGNVPVVVSLPGMANPIPFPAVPKRQYTRLPQHRPPLRRDKPVRISLPGQQPRYIYPSTERSFIFIPRALRPNQQGFRGRGRGGFYSGRRSSFYANSAYSASVTMSRRSSLGMPTPQEGFPSPAGSVMSRQTVVTTENGKPVVRLPPPRPLGGIVPPGPVNAPVVAGIPPPLPAAAPVPFAQPQPQYPPYRESRPAMIPMHQPRPQKAVSVADIETPANLGFNPPQPQQEQPFHQQVPMSVNGPVYGHDAPASLQGPPSSQVSVTPLSHIPDRAVHAQPFQPYGFQQPQGFYPPSFPSGSMYYPLPGTEYSPYTHTAAGPGASVPPPFAPPGQQVPYVVPGPPPAEQASQAGTVAHEAGGTVYYYDASQMYGNPSFTMSASGPGGVVGMGGMMTPPGTTYYYPQPQGVFYSAQ